MRVMLYCQHVLGMGHLVRSMEIARALAARFEVLFVSGGEVTPNLEIPSGVKLVCLPALQTDSNFSNLHSSSQSADLEDIKPARRQKLQGLFDQFRPGVLITEMFPFGRKQFEFELLPLLQAAKQRGIFITSSVRDVLVHKRDHESFERRAQEIINAYYDLVLIHGDPRLLSFDESFSRLADLACDVAYTGYVTPHSSKAVFVESADPNRHPAFVVSVGGGRCEQGHELVNAILRAAPLLAENFPHRIHAFAGPYVPDHVFARMQVLAAGQANIDLRRYTPDLCGHMRTSDLSLSMAGYNTVMNILSTGVRSLVYTAASNGDQEQEIRARKLESLGTLRVIRDLSPESLVDQIRESLNLTPAALHLDFDGAAQSARLLAASLAGRDVQFQPAGEEVAV